MKSVLRFILPGLLFIQSLAAQEPAPPATPPPSLVPPPAAPGPAVPAEPPKTITKEQTIYVPFEKLEQVFGKEDRGVFLPYREFLEMWNKLNLPAELKTKEPPVEGVLAGAAYSGKIEGDLATIHAKYNFEALKQGWSKVPLGAPNLSIAEAKSTAILSFADGGYEVLFPDKGSYTLDATIYGKITRDPGVSSLKLQLPKTAVSQFELIIPEKGLDFTITPASAYSATENPDGTTKLMVYFGGSQEVNIAWTRRAGETALKPLLFVEARSEVRISAGAVRTDASLNYRILRSGVDALDVLVPGSDQVLSVEGQNIREWTLQPAPAPGQPQKVHIVLHTPAKDTYALRVKTERALGTLPQKVTLPLVQADGVERQTGALALYVDPELVAETSDLQELTQQSAAATKEAATGLIGEYRYLRLPYAGTVSVSEAKPQIDVSSETLAVVEPDLLSLRATFDYEVKKAGIFSTQVELPAGFTRADATGDQIESAIVQKVDGRDVLQIKFSGRRTGKFAFVVTSEIPREKPDAPLTVPVFRIPGVERHEAKVGVAIHVSLKANTTDRGDLREEDISNLGQMPVSKPGTTPLTLGFRYRGEAKPAQVQFEPRKPRVSADVLTFLEVREALLRHVWTIQYGVEYAGVNEFSVEVPTAIADDLQIDGINIKERIRTDLKDPQGQATGRSVWRVVLQEKVLGNYSLRLAHDIPRGEQKAGESVPVNLEEVRVLNVFRETGEVAVVKDGNLEFTKTDAKGLELVDPKELNPMLQTAGVFLSYKYTAHPIGLRLDVSKNLYLDVPAAVVTYAVLNSVIAEDEAETTEVIYWVRNNAQQFFSIQLPSRGSGAKLLSDAFVDGEPQQPSRRPDRNELLIRLPARQESGEAFPVRFVYEVPSLHPGRRLGWRGHIELQPPLLNGVGVLQSVWNLYLPTEHRYVHFSGAMQAENGPRGWDSFRDLLYFFVPKVGPDGPDQSDVDKNEPPTLPAPKHPGFDTHIQHEGIKVALRRLDAPAQIRISYRSKGYAATVEAFALLLAFAFGVWLLGASRRARFLYFVLVGIGALVIGGAVDPRAARFWETIYLGVFAAVPVWFVVGFVRWVRSWKLSRPKPPTPPARPRTVTPPSRVTPPVPVAPAAPEPQPSSSSSAEGGGETSSSSSESAEGKSGESAGS